MYILILMCVPCRFDVLTIQRLYHLDICNCQTFLTFVMISNVIQNMFGREVGLRKGRERRALKSALLVCRHCHLSFTSKVSFRNIFSLIVWCTNKNAFTHYTMYSVLCTVFYYVHCTMYMHYTMYSILATIWQILSVHKLFIQQRYQRVFLVEIFSCVVN